jgi:hypothetical protein
VQPRMRRPNCWRPKTKPDRSGLEFGGTCNSQPCPRTPDRFSWHQESGSCVSQAAALDGEHLNRRRAPAQLRWPQRFNDKVVARTHEAQQIG